MVKDKHQNPDRKTVRTTYPSSNSHCDANKSPIKARLLKTKLTYLILTIWKKYSNQITKPNNNNNDKTTNIEEWKQGNTLVMGYTSASNLI